ncbi:hypothetical protein K502DRAFT_239115 [Neoconidiobolus thromboides FSU 785]|nr:hypothetical protein K502DRAFT_239115 [Neoconidiobolus thromboides FSU 785]
MSDSLVKCHHEYLAQQDDELNIKINDIIKVTKKHGDWWEGFNLTNEASGIFPANFVMPISETKAPVPEADYDYEAQAPDELNFAKGDIIFVLEKDDGWWKGEKDGKVGVFPANFVSTYKEGTPVKEEPETNVVETEPEPVQEEEKKDSSKRASIADGNLIPFFKKDILLK